ncbi:MAG: hypothetical protein J6R48_07585 [Muribaculaceae bacterium]|nr:hypothetical protein [Muribaculaceae bacterium]
MPRPKISINNLMYDDTGFSCSASVKNIIDYQKEGWRFAIDSVAVSILQGNFRDTGFKGKIGFPLLKKVAAADSTAVDSAGVAYPKNFEYAYLVYQAKVAAINKTEKHAGGTSTTFELKQDIDSIYIDCFLAKVKLHNDKTWFWLNHNTTRDEDKQTLFDFSLGGDITIGDGNLDLPSIPFSGLGYANCSKAEKEAAEKGFEQKDPNKQKPSTSGSEVKGPDGKRFTMGDWDFNKNDATSEDNTFKGFPLYIKDISFDLQGTERMGVKFNCGLSMLGNKKNGVSADVGLGVYAKIDWDNFDLSYDKTEVSEVSLDGHFGGVVTISGGLKVCDTDSISGFETVAGKPLNLGIKGLFNLDIAGGYYKMKKTAEDYALDSYSEKQDSTYHAGYFLGKASKMKIPLGPVNLNSVMGGLFINYSTTAGGISGTDNSFYDAIQSNAKVKYKSYGGAFGLGLASTGTDALLKGDLNFMLLMDMSGDEVKVPEFHMQGNIHALCADPSSEEGLINSRVDLIYQNTINDLDPQPDQCKSLTLNLTSSVDGTVDKLYEQFTGEKLEVPEAIGEFLSEFDAKNAAQENKGEGTDTSDKSSKTESSGFLKGGCSAEVKMELQIRDYPHAKGGEGETFWHLYIGKPTPEEERCRITFIDFEIGKGKPVGLWAKVYANAYLCVGNELPDNGALPPIPDKVLEALGMKGADGKEHPENLAKLDAARQDQLSGFKDRSIDGGIMFGAAMGAEIGCNAVFCYANVEGMLGLDLVLKKFSPGERCGDGSLMGGKNGFYAQGQAYAMFKGELGLMLDLWIYKGKVPLVDMTLGALLQAGFPNPTWVYGRVRASGSVLGGLIKFNSTIDLKAGKVCIPTYGNPLDDVKIFGDFNPGDEELERGWDENKAVSQYSTVGFTTNMKMGKYLPLVDQRRTAENIGMDDIPAEGEEADDKSVLRTYVFRLGRVDEKTGEPVTSVPTFEFTQYADNKYDNSPETSARYIECQNPSGDKENFTLVTGTLKANRFYRVNLSGYCKEVVNGREINPVFNDSTTNYQNQEKVWYQLQPVYFCTGESSQNLIEHVAGYTPMAVDDTKNAYTATLEDVINPTVMMKSDQEDYWNNPDYEFSATLMEYVASTDEKGNATGEWVYPDAKNGLYRGQKSVFQDLEVKLMTEEGVDEYGDDYFFQTVKLAQPLESSYFKKGGKYKFEITRFNRKLMTDHVNLIEQRYEDMMKVVESDKATFDAALAEMNDEEQAVAKQMYDYYMSMQEEYGDNTAEQRKTEFIEQAKQNSDMFAEVVWSHEYTYNGFASFLDYINTKHGGNIYTYSSDYVKIGSSNIKFKLPLQYMYSGRTFNNAGFTRDNNPYYAMNYWHSKAFVWYSSSSSDKDGKLDKFKYCDANIMACEGLDYGTYEGTYTSTYKAPTKVSDLPPSSSYRLISLGITRYDWAGKRNDWEVERMLDPIYAKEEKQTRWHTISTGKWSDYSLGDVLVEDVATIYQTDCDAIGAFESRVRYLWDQNTKYSSRSELSGDKLTKFKNSNTTAANNNTMMWAAETSNGGLITAPEWQMGLMLGADNGHIKEVKTTRSQNVASYKYMMGDGYDSNENTFSGYYFKPNDFLKKFKTLTFRVRYPDGYNQRSDTYEVRPESQGHREVKLVCSLDENGLSDGYSATHTTQKVADVVHFSDAEFRRYLIDNFDKKNGGNNDGELSSTELSNVTSISVDLSIYEVKSFSGVELLPNLQSVSMFSYCSNGPDFDPNKPYLDLNSVPKLTQVNFSGINCNNVRFDLSKAEYLSSFSAVNSSISNIKFNPNLNLKSLTCTRGKEIAKYVKNYKNLTYLKLDGCGAESVSIVGLHKLVTIDVKGFEKTNKNVLLTADRIAAYDNYLNSEEFKKLNSYTGKSSDCKVIVRWNDINTNMLDENLRLALEEIAGTEDIRKNTKLTQLTNLDLRGRKIKSLKYLEVFCPSLNTLKVDNNKLTELDLSGFNNLSDMSATNNDISYVDVAEDNTITYLDVTNNQIPSLPTQKMGYLKTLKCSNNYIEELYGNHLKEIRYLDCSDNNLTELILDQTLVEELDCSNNNLTEFKLPNRKDLLEKLSANNCFGDAVSRKFDFTSYSNLMELSLADNAGITELKIPTHQRIKTVVARNCNLEGIFSFAPGLRTTDLYPFIETIDMSNNPNLKVVVNSPYFGYNLVKNVNFTGCNVISVVIGGMPSHASGLQVRVGVPQRLTGNKVKIQFTDGGVDWFDRWEEWRKYPENQHTVVAFTTVDGVAKYYDSQSLTLENISKECQEMRKDLGEKLYASLLKEKNNGKALEEQSRVFKVSDAKALTKLNAANMGIKDLARVLRWMPNLTEVDASGNEIATINLQNQKIDDKAVYPLYHVTSLNLSNNSRLSTLIMQAIVNLELSNSAISTTTFNHVATRVKNRLTINNPGGITSAYMLDNNLKATFKVLHYGNTSKNLIVNSCNLDSLVVNNASFAVQNISSNAKNISIDHFVAKGQDAKVSLGAQQMVKGEMMSVELNTTIATNALFENTVMTNSSLNDWIVLTSDLLRLKNCTATDDLTIAADGVKKINLEQMNANVKVSSCDFTQLTLDNASIILGGENTSQINIDQLRISGNSTIYFQTADMMLMWLYNWRNQNPGQNVNVRVSAMVPEKESLALLANTFIGSGQLDLNNMSQVEIIKSLNYLVEQGYIPKGDLYDQLINKLTKGEPLVEPTTEEDRLMRSDFGEKLYNSLLSDKNKGRTVKSEVLHVEDVKPLTKLNASNMDIKDLTRVLRWMPNLTDVNASSNNIETINLQNQMLEGKAVYPLQNVTSLNLSYNSKLSSIAMQSVNNVNLTGTAVNTKTFSHVVQRTKNKLVISSPVKAGTDSYTLDCSAKPLKVLYYVNTSHNMNITSCNLDTLVANSARITLGGSNTSSIEIKNMKVNNGTTINFQSADMMLMWLLGWQKQNVGVTITYKVTAMTSAQQSIATNINTYLSTINLNDMSQTEILNVVNNTLIGTYGLPKGDSYDEVMSKINNGEKLVEYSLPVNRNKGNASTSGTSTKTTRTTKTSTR